MAMVSFPFDSIYTQGASPEYDREVGSEVFARLLSAFFSNGVIDGNSFAVTPGTGMKVNVSAGKALINGRFCADDNAASLNIAAANASYNRYDSVVLRLNLDVNSANTAIERSIYLLVKTGTAAASPTVPALTRTSQYYELRLANILVKKGATSIIQANITDTRTDSNQCGIVAAAIKAIDTTTLFNQLQAAITAKENYLQNQVNTWLSQLSDLLDGNTAANLAAQIRALTTAVAGKAPTVHTHNANQISGLKSGGLYGTLYAGRVYSDPLKMVKNEQKSFDVEVYSGANTQNYCAAVGIIGVSINKAGSGSSSVTSPETGVITTDEISAEVIDADANHLDLSQIRLDGFYLTGTKARIKLKNEESKKQNNIQIMVTVLYRRNA